VDQHAGRDLVADLDHVGARAGRDQRVQYLGRIGRNAVRQLRDGRSVAPGGRDDLFPGIGPGVAVVKVQQKAHALGLDLLSELDRVRGIAVGLGLGASSAGTAGVAVLGVRLDESAQPDVVEAVRLQNLQHRLLGAVGVRVSGAAIDRFLDARDIGTEDEARRHGRACGPAAAGVAAGRAASIRQPCGSAARSAAAEAASAASRRTAGSGAATRGRGARARAGTTARHRSGGTAMGPARAATRLVRGCCRARAAACANPGAAAGRR
jgi:hypothetical protein